MKTSMKMKLMMGMQTSLMIQGMTMETDTAQVNPQTMNMLLQATVSNTKEARKIIRQVPDNILEMVEIERLRRFEIIMEIPPIKLLAMINKKLLPWM